MVGGGAAVRRCGGAVVRGCGGAVGMARAARHRKSARRACVRACGRAAEAAAAHPNPNPNPNPVRTRSDLEQHVELALVLVGRDQPQDEGVVHRRQDAPGGGWWEGPWIWVGRDATPHTRQPRRATHIARPPYWALTALLGRRPPPQGPTAGPRAAQQVRHARSGPHACMHAGRPPVWWEGRGRRLAPGLRTSR